jgi:hypothetical protein
MANVNLIFSPLPNQNWNRYLVRLFTDSTILGSRLRICYVIEYDFLNQGYPSDNSDP